MHKTRRVLQPLNAHGRQHRHAFSTNGSACCIDDKRVDCPGVQQRCGKPGTAFAKDPGDALVGQPCQHRQRIDLPGFGRARQADSTPGRPCAGISVLTMAQPDRNLCGGLRQLALCRNIQRL